MRRATTLDPLVDAVDVAKPSASIAPPSLRTGLTLIYYPSNNPVARPARAKSGLLA